MIFGNINDEVQFDILCKDPKLKIALEYLKKGDFTGSENRIELEDGVYLSSAKVKTTEADTKRFETHRNYYDIHFVIKGVEVIYVAPLNTLENLSEYKPDIQFGDAKKAQRVVLHEGDYLVTLKDDAHIPACGYGHDLEKICVKIPL